MSQPSVAAYFNTRKRQASDDLRNKAKVLLVDQEQKSIRNHDQAPTITDTPEAASLTPIREEDSMGTSPKVVLVSGKEATGSRPLKSSSVVRNIQFDSPKSSAHKTTKLNLRGRTTRSRKLSTEDGQADIRESLLKMNDEADAKKVLFEKKGALSPKKKLPVTPKKNMDKVKESNSPMHNEQSAAGSVTPKKSLIMNKMARQDMGLNEIKNRITKSTRLMELKASIARIKNCEQRLEKLQKQNEPKKPCIQKFEKIQLEIPVSPQKSCRSPSKALLSPTKNELLNASPQRRILFEPKETVASPIKGSPTKAPAYQRYLSIAESGSPALPLPYGYRFLAEAFRCVETVSAMLHNRKETVTFRKLKPAVQELLRRNFTLEHLAQIKTVLPDAYTYSQEKYKTFGSTSKQDKYELVLTPVVEAKSGRNTPDADNVLRTASEVSMGPGVLLERRRQFYDILLDKVKDEHENFLLSLETPMNIPKEKILRWHPEFDVESCKSIEQAELPQPPNVEKATSAKDVLEKAKSLFNCSTRMEKALQRLAETKLTSRSASPQTPTIVDETTQITDNNVRKVEITVVDTPPATPTTQNSYLATAFKGIPKALLEKVRAKQAAKALEAMTRTPNADKEAALYSRLPELAKILRNIFVAEKKGVLTLEFVTNRLDNSFRAKLTPAELEDHIRLLCKLLPTWISIHNVRKVNYLKLAKDYDLAKIVKRLEIMANDKVSGL